MHTHLLIIMTLLGAAAPVAKECVAMELEVIPQPRRVEFVGDGFDPATARTIHVSDTPDNRFAARLLRETLRETHGVDCDVALEPQTAPDVHMAWVSGGAQAPPAAPDFPAGQEKEGYALVINADGAALIAKNETGLFYGIQTLVQLVEQSHRDKAILPGMLVADWPEFGVRGRYFDGSQYRGSIVATRANLEKEIKTLARYKMNCLSIDLYNLVPFESFPYCADEYTLSRSDWDYLVELSRRYHVTLFPSVQSFAQIYQIIWNCEEGKPYREETAPGLICPSRPENITFLKNVYRDLMTVFKYSPYLGVGCSEVGMQWQEHYCPLCQKRLDAGETVEEIYYQHVKNCATAVSEVAKELGRDLRPMMWADEFYCGYGGKRWEGIENIPRDVLMGHWQYWSHYQNMPDYAATDYDGITGLLERGFDVLFLSASFEFNTYIHDLTPDEPKDGKWNLLYDAGIRNIADQAKWAAVHNQKGLAGKVVGGGCATFSQHDIRGWDTTWYAFILQGEYSWGDPSRSLDTLQDHFTDAYAATFYGARDRESAQAIAAAFRELDAAKSDLERNNYLIRDFIGEYDIHDNFYNGNDLVKSLDLINAMTAAPGEPGKTLDDVRSRAVKTIETANANRVRLASLAGRVDNTYSLHYLISAARKIANHATRAIYMLDQEALLTRLAVPMGDVEKQQALAELDALGVRLATIIQETKMITDEMDGLAFGAATKLVWGGEGTSEVTADLSGDTTGYHKVLASLAAFRQRLDDARATLADTK